MPFRPCSAACRPRTTCRASSSSNCCWTGTSPWSVLATLAGRPELRLADIAAYPLVLPPPETVTWAEIQRLFVSQGLQMNETRIETIYLELSRACTQTSDAVWFASTRHVKPDLEQGLLDQLSVDCSMLEAPLGIIARQGAGRHALRDQLLEMIRQYVLSSS